MDYEELKKEIKVIAEIASTVPEVFRQKCFEILLQNLLGSEKLVRRRAGNDQPREDKADIPKPGKLPTPAQIRVLMSRTGVTQEDLESIFLSKTVTSTSFASQPQRLSLGAR